MIGVMPTAEELLRTTPIFSRLSQADRHTIAEVSRVQDFGKGETIFEQQSPSDPFYAIVSGRVKIMSRWNKDDIVRTDKDGFVVLAIPELERLAAG
jgi:CRP-like cAMP-binding protein